MLKHKAALSGLNKKRVCLLNTGAEVETPAWFFVTLAPLRFKGLFAKTQSIMRDDFIFGTTSESEKQDWTTVLTHAYLLRQEIRTMLMAYGNNEEIEARMKEFDERYRPLARLISEYADHPMTK